MPYQSRHGSLNAKAQNRPESNPWRWTMRLVQPFLLGLGSAWANWTRIRRERPGYCLAGEAKAENHAGVPSQNQTWRPLPTDRLDSSQRPSANQTCPTAQSDPSTGTHHEATIARVPFQIQSPTQSRQDRYSNVEVHRQRAKPDIRLQSHDIR